MKKDKLDDFIDFTLKSQDINIPNVNETMKEFKNNINKKEKRKMMSAKQMAMVAAIVLLVGSPIAMKSVNFNNGGIDKPGIEGNIQIPNPIKEFTSIEEAEKFSGFKIEKPSFMVEGYENYSIIGIDNEENGKLIRQKFNKGDAYITFDKFSNTIESDGDYNLYEKDESIEINNLKINIFRGENGTYKAKWHSDGFNYSLTGNPDVSKDSLISIVEGLNK